MGGLFAIDTPGPQRFIPIVALIYSQVLEATWDEGVARNGLYRTIDQSIPSMQPIALSLPAGMTWNIPKVVNNGTTGP